jgi:SAM-dependent methyltransferase
MSYRALAPVYDALTKNVNYKRRAQYIERVLKNKIPNNLVLDAGCGTGTLTLLLAKKGYEMIGIDASPEMLSIAQAKTENMKNAPIFLAQSLSELDLYGTVGAVVCTQDTLNHLGKSLRLVLKRFSLFTERGGYLIFDINTPYKHQTVLADNTFVYETPDSTCVWQNHYEKWARRVRLKIDVFLKQDQLYQRQTDEFYEYTVKPQYLEKLLEQNKYEVLEIIDGENYKPATAQCHRLLFVAKKG